MRIVRGPRPDTGYTVLDNVIIRDSRLSWKARGILVYLLSQPDGWESDSVQLAAMAKDGRDATRTGLAELRETGYLMYEKTQDPTTGRWSTAITVVDNPGTGFPASAQSVVNGANTPGAGFSVPGPTPGFPTPGFPAAGFSGGKEPSTKPKEQILAAPSGGGEVVPLFPTPQAPPKKAAERARNDLFDAVAAACGISLEQITKTAGSECGKAAAEIRAAGGTAAMVTLYARRYRQKFGANITLSPSALAKWWPTLATSGTESGGTRPPGWEFQ